MSLAARNESKATEAESAGRKEWGGKGSRKRRALAERSWKRSFHFAIAVVHHCEQLLHDEREDLR